MKTITNSSMFIVPNSLMSPRSDLWSKPLADLSERAECCNYRMRKDELAPWGIEAKLDDTFVQVWIHCDEEDNLSDHGFGFDNEGPLSELFPQSYKPDSDDNDINMLTAPKFLPIRLFEGKKEGDFITLTTKDGVAWDIKLEQLPYRYGHFGKFEDTLARLIRKDKQDCSKLETMAGYLRNAKIKPVYTEPEAAAVLGRLTMRNLKFKLSSSGEDTYLDVVLHSIEKEIERRIAIIHYEGDMEVLQHNFAECGLEFGQEFERVARAFSDTSAA